MIWQRWRTLLCENKLSLLPLIFVLATELFQRPAFDNLVFGIRAHGNQVWHNTDNMR